MSETLEHEGEEWTYESTGGDARLDGISADEAYQRRWRERFRYYLAQRDQGLMPYALDSTLEDRAKEECRDELDVETGARMPHRQDMHWHHAYERRKKAMFDQVMREREMGLIPHQPPEALMAQVEDRARKHLEEAIRRHEIDEAH